MRSVLCIARSFSGRVPMADFGRWKRRSLLFFDGSRFPVSDLSWHVLLAMAVEETRIPHVRSGY